MRLSSPFSYWRLKDRYFRLLGSRCLKCKNEHFPNVRTCQKCGSHELGDKEMPKTGKILTFTRLHDVMPGFQDEDPMTFGLVELDNGVKVVTQLVDTNYDSLKMGDAVKAVFRRVRTDGESGQIFYGYKFVKV